MYMLFLVYVFVGRVCIGMHGFDFYGLIGIFDIYWQGTSSRVASGEILQEKLPPSKENRIGLSKWDLCESQHGWSSIP